MINYKRLSNNKEDKYEFRSINNEKKIVLKNNMFYNDIENETFLIDSYFKEKINNFPKLFEKDLSSIRDTKEYLESISIPNKCECAGIIDTIPGWKCIDCSKNENAIYCSNCYIKSKDLHKGHKVYYLRSSGGMCDCGDPDCLNIFCPDHCGPFTKQKQIDEIIIKSFSSNIIKNLKKFFDDLFQHFSNYFILTEKCKYFINELLNENEINSKEKEDITLLKENFSIVFQNFLNFLYKITEKNIGMFHLISLYLLENHFIKGNENKKYQTSHTCFKFEINNIQILYKEKSENKDIFSCFDFFGKEQHECQCPFIRLLISNWRDNVKPYYDLKQNQKLLLSFSHNFFLRSSLSMLFICIYKEILLNNNEDILYVRNQFFLSESTELIAKKTNLIEEIYEFLYYYFKKNIYSINSKEIKKDFIKEFEDKIDNFMYDSKYFLRGEIMPLINSKISIFERLIDIFCIIHNQMEFLSIFPHPEFQEKECSIDFIQLEEDFLFLFNINILCIQWKDINNIKVIFNYFIEKINNQKENEIKILEKNEFSYHLALYRAFGTFINYFCFNYALINNTDINDSINIIKNNFFKSKNQMQNIINLILNDYFKMFGFIIGIRNGYFKYYDIDIYNGIYFTDFKELKIDFTLLKYLFAISEEKINLENILIISNIENVYKFFDNVFNSKNKNDKVKEIKKMKMKISISCNCIVY